MKKIILSVLFFIILNKSFSNEISFNIDYNINNFEVFNFKLNKTSFTFDTFQTSESINQINLNVKNDTTPPPNIVIVDSNKSKNLDYDMTSLGAGLGLDYGGIGINITHYLTKHFGLFGGVGFAGYKPSYNVGLKLRFNPEPKTGVSVPYFTAMYGYNAVVVIKNGTNYNRIFYGPSVGFGIDIKSSKKKKYFWTIQIIVPIRSDEVYEYINYLKRNPYVKLNKDLLPITISVGIRKF